MWGGELFVADVAEDWRVELHAGGFEWGDVGAGAGAGGRGDDGDCADGGGGYAGGRVWGGGV